MSRVLKWIALILAGLLLALGVVVLVVSVFRLGSMPMIMMGRGFRGPFPFMFGRVGTLGMWAFILARLFFPLMLIALLVLGGVLIGRSLSRPAAPVARASCPNCGKPVQADWNNCPYCGTNLRSSEPGITQEQNTV